MGKRKKYILVIILLLLFIMIFISLFMKEDIISGNKDKIVKATIVLEPKGYAKRIVVEDRKSLKELIELIEKTNDIYVNRSPNHSETIQTDSAFEVELQYQDGQVDILETTEGLKRIYRRLPTKRNKETGYVSGHNEKLIEYLKRIGDTDDARSPGVTPGYQK